MSLASLIELRLVPDGRTQGRIAYLHASLGLRSASRGKTLLQSLNTIQEKEVNTATPNTY